MYVGNLFYSFIINHRHSSSLPSITRPKSENKAISFFYSLFIAFSYIWKVINRSFSKSLSYHCVEQMSVNSIHVSFLTWACLLANSAISMRPSSKRPISQLYLEDLSTTDNQNSLHVIWLLEESRDSWKITLKSIKKEWDASSWNNSKSNKNSRLADLAKHLNLSLARFYPMSDA